MSARRRAALALSSFLASLEHPLRVPAGEFRPEELWSLCDASLARVLRLSELDRTVLAVFRRSFDSVAAEAALEDAGVRMLPRGDAAYPDSLANIHDPPLAIFVAGEPARLEEFMASSRIAIVGARASTSYGADAARILSEGLSRRSVCVVSGLALGIDTVAHRGALDGPGGTMAVLGCGAEIVYPRRNRRVYEAILRSGVIVSEYPPGTEPRPWRFPARNRIIAGLADGVVIVEAAKKSGALITADFSMDQGREVFAVPGSIFSEVSEGPNGLIKSGATPVTGVEDVLLAMGIEEDAGETAPGSASQKNMRDAEKRVYRVLGGRPLAIDAIAARSGMEVTDVTVILASLELGGAIRFEPGRGYSV